MNCKGWGFVSLKRTEINIDFYTIYKEEDFDFKIYLFIKSTALAPIVVEILMSRGSAYKIVTDSGIKLLKNSILARTILYNV